MRLISGVSPLQFFHQIRSVSFVRSYLVAALLSEDKEVLEDLLAAACNDTVRKVEQAQSEKMQDVGGGLLGGLNLPFGKMPF